MKSNIYQRFYNKLMSYSFFKDRPYLDFWSFTHVLLGFVLSWLFYSLGFTPLNVGLMVFGLASFWEVIEIPLYQILFDIQLPEAILSQTSDVFWNMLGFLIAFLVLI